MRNEIDPRFKMVRKSNELIQRSRFKFSAQQQKILLFLISQIKPGDDDFGDLTFSIRDFCDLCGIDIDNGKNYANLKKAIQGISDRSTWITLPDGRETLVRWIEKPYIDPGSGLIQLRMDRDMKPYLLHLRRNFTQYEICYTLKFRSKYTIRLYELIMSIHYDELKPYTYDFDLSYLMDRMDAKRYEGRFCDFHKKALKPAVDEINRLSDKKISYELIKKGRTVQAVHFTIETKDPIERYRLALA